MRARPWLPLVLTALACEGGGSASRPDTGGPGPDYLERLESAEDFARLEGEGHEVKFLGTVDGRAPLVEAECLLQNTERFPYHLQFLRAVFPDLGDLDFDGYVALVLHEATRRWWGGALKRYDAITHPRTGRPGIVGYLVYQDPASAEELSGAQIVEVDRRLKACAPFAADTLVFVPSPGPQEAHVRALLAALGEQGVAVRFPEELVEHRVEVYSEGETYGFLHVVPPGAAATEDYGARDVLVVEAAPPELTTVAGVISTLPQNVHSHLNLRMREKELPNALLADAYEDPRVLALADRLVHVEARDGAIAIEEASAAEAERWWNEHRRSLGALPADLTVDALQDLAVLTHDDAIAYGAKAANLGELHGVLPPENRVEGFAIPFSCYDDFVVDNGLDREIAALLTDAQVGADRVHRQTSLDALRDAFRDGAIAPAFLGALTERLRDAFGETTFVRFRSSTNAEDLTELSGAGLYDSRSGCLADDLDGDEDGPSRCLSEEHRASLEAELAARREELAAHPERWWLPDLVDDLQDDLDEEKTVADALRKVWASLWNLRAFDERELYGIDHTAVYMGMAVHPTFVLERREAVAITNLRPDDGDPLYRVVSQVGEIGVVRPIDPSAVPETMTFRRGAGGRSEASVVVPSSLSPGGAPLWSEAEMATLAALLFGVQDHFAAEVYPELQGLRLDLEIELTADERIVIKQARPYLGVE